jgi:hypothetical protein
MRLRSVIGAENSRSGATAKRGCRACGYLRLRHAGLERFDFAGAAGGGGSALEACAPEIGFVLPKRSQLRSGGDRGPRVACPAATGFVPPKPTQLRRGGDRGPWVAAPRRRRRAFQGIERPDCGFPPRQRPPLVAVEPHQPDGDVAGGGEPFDHDLLAQAADALDVDLRLGDAQRGRAARLARVLAGDPSGQVGGLRREPRIGEHRLVQPMPQRVARAPLLAGGRARPGAARRIGAVGGQEGRAGHAGSPCVPGTRLNSPSSTVGAAARSASSAAFRSRSAARRLSIA